MEDTENKGAAQESSSEGLQDTEDGESDARQLRSNRKTSVTSEDTSSSLNFEVQVSSDMVQIKKESEEKETPSLPTSKTTRLQQQLQAVLSSAIVKEEPVDEEMQELHESSGETIGFSSAETPLENVAAELGPPSLNRSDCSTSDGQNRKCEKLAMPHLPREMQVKKTRRKLMVLPVVGDCMVCNIPCRITQNRKIPVLPFCKKCKKAYFYQMSRIHGGRKQPVECRRGGNCEIDYRTKICPQCQHSKFQAVLKTCGLSVKANSVDVLCKYRWGKPKRPRKYYPRKKWSWTIVKDGTLKKEALAKEARVVVEKLSESTLQQYLQPQTDDQENWKSDGEESAKSLPIKTDPTESSSLSSDEAWTRPRAKRKRSREKLYVRLNLNKPNQERKKKKIPTPGGHGILCQLLQGPVTPLRSVNKESASDTCNGVSTVTNLLTEAQPVALVPEAEPAVTSMPKKLTDSENSIRVYMFSCGHACADCNTLEGTDWLNANGYEPVDPVRNKDQSAATACSQPQASLNSSILAKLNEVNLMMLNKDSTAMGANPTFSTKPIKPILAPVSVSGTTTNMPLVSQTPRNASDLGQNTQAAQKIPIQFSPSTNLQVAGNITNSQRPNNQVNVLTVVANPPTVVSSAPSAPPQLGTSSVRYALNSINGTAVLQPQAVIMNSPASIPNVLTLNAQGHAVLLNTAVASMPQQTLLVSQAPVPTISLSSQPTPKYLPLPKLPKK